MFSRLLRCGVLVVGASLFGMACGPTAEAGQDAPVQQGRTRLYQLEDEKKPACTGREPGYRYISRDPAQCAATDWICDEGYQQFFNECGCGCRPDQTACDYNDPTRIYVARDPNECIAVTYICEEGYVGFFDECGCGCELAP